MRLDSLVRVSLPLYLYPRMLGYAVRLSQRAGGRRDALAPFGQSTSILPTLGVRLLLFSPLVINTVQCGLPFK